MYKIYFTYIFFIKVRYIRQNIFGIYFNEAEIYFRAQKLCIAHIYFIFMWRVAGIYIMHVGKEKLYILYVLNMYF